MEEIKKDSKWQEKYKKEYDAKQQAELETSIIKAVGMNSPEMKKAIAQQKELEISLANALEINESHHKLNGKLQERLTELEEENKKMYEHLNKQVENARKSGM